MTPHSASTPCRLAIAVRGIVQGVGFRPFVYNAAVARGLSGWVQNQSGEVLIEVEGPQASVDEFLQALHRDHPPQARVDAIEVHPIACQCPPSPASAASRAGPARREFKILHSDDAAAPQPTLPADLAACGLCLAEIHDPLQRRYCYPFTNCTNCGPRWSIIRQLPYDRPRTSMAPFAMCPQCLAEYGDPADRRFHAQPIACPQCGPALELLDAGGRRLARREEALEMSARLVREGGVLALKGLGGFQLAVNATSASAVALLRVRKHRPTRPFAVMLADLDEVRRFCEVSDDEARALVSPEAPILLLRGAAAAWPSRWRRATRGWASCSPTRRCTASLWRRSAARSSAPAETSPKSRWRLRSTTPWPGWGTVHARPGTVPVSGTKRSLVGRKRDCPLQNCRKRPLREELRERPSRAQIADAFLTHDRPIVRPVNDSVARFDAEGLQVLRRARGYAPLPIELDIAGPAILAVGGHLKNTVALALGGDPLRVVLSPHVGDLDSPLAVNVFRRAIDDLVEFFQVRPVVVACDLHPDYASTRVAEELAARWNAPLAPVQHHHAHVAACMAEHRLAGPVLGLAWDGVGYGGDGTIWGGEALVCQGDTFVRAAHLRTFPLPGGDLAMRQPRRAALGLLYEIRGDAAAEHLLPPENTGRASATQAAGGAQDFFTAREMKTLFAAMARSVNSPRASSMGRLFDGVAALVGLPQIISFEGEAAMALEFAADESTEDAYPFPLRPGTPVVADWEPLVRGVLADRAAGVPIGRISARFHNALAELALAVAQRAGVRQVALSGGCFQNARLSDSVRRRLGGGGLFGVHSTEGPARRRRHRLGSDLRRRASVPSPSGRGLG